MPTQIPRFYRQQPHKQSANDMLGWGQNRLVGREVDLQNILRWEEDGGRIVEVNGSTVGLHANQFKSKKGENHVSNR